MKIGVIGARVAGSYAGLLLSRLGHEVVLFDDSVEKEKPCGGGVTFKALRKMKWLSDHPLPRTRVGSIRLITREGYTSNLPLPHPIHIFPRLSLESSLRHWAISAGAHFKPERVLGFFRDNGGWSIQTAGGETGVDYLIGADGAKSLVRTSLIGNYASGDLSLALGYTIPRSPDERTVLISFQESGFQGYIWSFPQVGQASVGILQSLPQANAADLRKRVEEFIKIHHPEADAGKRFYAATIPSLSRKSLVGQRVCGKNWALLGDAAGFTDAITAEGIYYALRSAELLAQAFDRGDPTSYESAWRSDFRYYLESAAAWKDRFYGGTVFFASFVRRALQSLRYSGTVQTLLDNLISGHITYKSLFVNLVLRSPWILLQVFRNRSLVRH